MALYTFCGAALYTLFLWSRGVIINLLRSLIIFDFALAERATEKWIQDQIQEENQSLASGGRVWKRKFLLSFCFAQLRWTRQRKADIQ